MLLFAGKNAFFGIFGGFSTLAGDFPPTVKKSFAFPKSNYGKWYYKNELPLIKSFKTRFCKKKMKIFTKIATYFFADNTLQKMVFERGRI